MTANNFTPPAPKKSLGQNFLRDRRVIQRILSAAEISNHDYVLEIGPGTGCLTGELLEAARLVTALEIDRRMVEYLRKRLAVYSNLSLIQADALRYDYDTLFSQPDSGVKLIANLPYYIATPLVQLFIKLRRFFALMVLMLPTDVAGRMTAAPGNKDYGYFSILTQFYFQIEPVCRAPAQAFFPSPNVDSLVLKFTPWTEPPLTVQDEVFYWRIIKAAFSQRRKTLINALHNSLHWEKARLLAAMEEARISPKIRAETLSAGEFARLADCMSARKPLAPES